MLTTRIGLVSRSQSVSFSNLVNVASAISLQVSRDLAPIWNVSGVVTPLESEQQIGPGVWPVYVVDEVPNGMGGFHLTEHQQPYAIVKSGTTWSLSASHEILEMMVDPSGNRLVASNAVDVVNDEVVDTDGKVEYLLEVCDPSENDENAYLIDGVLVSDFYTPNFFDPAGNTGARYSFNGRIARPRQVLPNGYLTWYDPQSDRLRQIRYFGTPKIVDLGWGQPGSGLTGGLSLRSFVDGQTRTPQSLSALPPSSSAVQRRSRRQETMAPRVTSRSKVFSSALATAMMSAPHIAAASMAQASRDDALQALNRHRALFALPGVVSVRPALATSAEENRYCVLVTAVPEQLQALATVLPAALDSIPVKIRPASSLQQYRASDPSSYLMVAAARHELREPTFPGELFFDGAGRQTDLPIPLEAFSATREPLEYSAPNDVTLDAVEEDMTLILHASPDAGWAQLYEFLNGIKGKTELVVGMYDFTSSHIYDALLQGLGAEGTLTLTLDHPAPNPSRDQTDDETMDKLGETLRERLKAAWALTGADPKAPVWIYPNAYHIKVAVRADDTFWLSSGNWNNSNQPVIDLTDDAAAKRTASKSDRDWHVIGKSPTLANTFRAFLRHDEQVAAEAERSGVGEGVLERIQLPAVPPFVEALARAPQAFFLPKQVSGRMRVQPLLTPDNYTTHVLPLIQSATKRFCMQTQYIHPSGREGDKNHDSLIAAVAKLIADGVEVRLITSQYETDDWVEKLIDAGIPSTYLRRQARVHNKGIVVDSKTVMVSSQNWSADGTQRNRDAGLIIYHVEAAAYFESIFNHDWELAQPVQS